MSGRACCSECGRALPKPKAVRLHAVETVDLESMSDAELYAYRKRTAIPEDLRFFLRLNLSPALRA